MTFKKLDWAINYYTYYELFSAEKNNLLKIEVIIYYINDTNENIVLLVINPPSLINAPPPIFETQIVDKNHNKCVQEVSLLVMIYNHYHKYSG